MTLLLAMLTYTVSSTTPAPLPECTQITMPGGGVPRCTDCIFDTRNTLDGHAQSLGGHPSQPTRVVVTVRYEIGTKSYEFPTRLGEAGMFSVPLGTGIDGTLEAARIRRGKPGAFAELELTVCKPPMRVAPSAEDLR